MVASYVSIHHSILWTVDQCWNIIEPKYEEWQVTPIKAAANNTSSSLTVDELNAPLEEPKEGDLPEHLKSNGGTSIIGYVFSGIMGLGLLFGLIYGIYLCISVDVNDPDFLKYPKYGAIYFATITCITFIIAIVLGNFVEKFAIKKHTGATTAANFKVAYNFARILILVGIGILMVIFTLVLMFSYLLFLRYNELLAAPLFLLTFIVSVTALTFGGIAISSAAAAIHLHTKGAATDDANTCSCVLLL